MWGEMDVAEVNYSESFKRAMVKKMVGPGARTATVLHNECGVPQPTLSRWLREAGKVAVMSDQRDQENKKQQVERRRPSDWSNEEKLQAVNEAAALSDDELGEFLRRKGLHAAQLNEWRKIILSALGGKPSRKADKVEAKRIKELERELRRKDKALAEAAALLVLKKKMEEYWGVEDDDTPPKKGK